MTAATPQMLQRNYAYRIYPTSWQQGELDRQRLCCDLYNAALEQRTRMWRALLLKSDDSVIAAERGRL